MISAAVLHYSRTIFHLLLATLICCTSPQLCESADKLEIPQQPPRLPFWKTPLLWLEEKVGNIVHRVWRVVVAGEKKQNICIVCSLILLSEKRSISFLRIKPRNILHHIIVNEQDNSGMRLLEGLFFFYHIKRSLKCALHMKDATIAPIDKHPEG